MSDLIRREDVVKAMNEALAVGDISMAIANDILNDIPSAEHERKKGRWIYDTERVTSDGFVHSQYHCSNCGYQVTGWIPNYCQYCGADMRGE